MKKTILLLIMSISLFGCGQDAIEEGMTTEEVQAIASASYTIIQNAITNAINEETSLDPIEIAEQINQIDGVISTELNATHSGVIVALEGGLTSTVFLINPTDDWWYFEDNESENTKSGDHITAKQTATNIIVPKGNGRALILAPFQHDFNTDMDNISGKLKSAGYEVDLFPDSEVSFEKFRGDFLSQYDIVIIDTHGGVTKLASGELTTSINTGIVYTDEYHVPKEGQGTLLLSNHDDISYFAITPQWLRATTTQRFKDTWIYVTACEGAYYDDGVGSLSKAFLDLGAKGFNGFDYVFSVELGNAMLYKMVDNFTDSQNFIEASENTKNASYPQFWILRTVRDWFGGDTNVLSPTTFDTHQRGEDPFYIVPPDGYQIIPTVNITSINNITGTTADCDCEVTYEGWESVTDRGVCWSTSVNPTTSNSKTTDGEGPGPYTSNITGLSPNTTYYVRAYATNSLGTAYDEEQRTFTTNAEATTPSVTTGDVTNITTTTASCSGNVTSDGGSSVTARGVCWSTSQNPTTSNSKIINGTGLGTYTSNITGLSPNTTYYVRAYAINSQGTAYGEQKTFTTNAQQAMPSVTTGNVTNITTITADCSGDVTSDGGSSVTARGVCWSTSQNPTTSNSKTTNGTGLGTYTSNITGLSPNTTYYVRAYATNSNGTSYGEQKSFKTSQEEGGATFTDYRDGNVYKTVVIGSQVWMAENLAYLPSVSPPYKSSHSSPFYYVNDYNGTNVIEAKSTSNYQSYGVLYNWPAALTACPDGWHLPSDDEWTQLETYLANNGYNYDGSIGLVVGIVNKIAKSMASATGWNASDRQGSPGNTDYPEYRNKSGFTAFPGGYSTPSGLFHDIGIFVYWWSSTENDESDAWYRSLYYSSIGVYRDHHEKGLGFSVRCIRD